MKACPNCKTDEHLAVYTYDNGWRHVECTKCNYLGPGEGSKLSAIEAHNKAADQDDLVECGRCEGSGFDTPGTGYDNVCSECGGQKALPRS